jgi:hypothetical protein
VKILTSRGEPCHTADMDRCLSVVRWGCYANAA